MRIKILDEQVANQIAAGEVVERPVSVVKELVENAIDSGSRRIDIEIERGGMRLIRVRDTGCGIPKEDLPLALTRHATSKIKKAEDLQQIMSLGFRGEALASIAAVSRLVVNSRMAGHRSAWRIQIEGRSLEPSVVPVAHNDGTTVEVRDLFYNTPARRKFLRTEKTEYGHIEELVRRLALSRFDLGFIFKHNKRIIFDFQPAHDVLHKEQRLAKIYGAGFMKQAVAIDMEGTGMQLTGWIGLPEYSRSQADQQAFFINSRVIRDKVINHAVRQAYGDKIHEGRYCAYALYLTIDTNEVDVNVHPTKSEVRFSEARLVHDFIVNSVIEAIEKSHEVVQMKFDEANTEKVRPVSQIVEEREQQSSALVQTAMPPPSPPEVKDYGLVTEELPSNFQDYVNAVVEPDFAHGPLGKAIAQVHEQYIIAENTEGLVLVDIKKIQQIITHSKLFTQFNEKMIATQPLLIPEAINVSEDALAHLKDYQGLFNQVGLELDQMGDTELVLRKIPVLLRNVDFSVLVNDILNYVSEHDDVSSELLLHRLAQHATDKARNKLSLQEMNILLRELEKLNHEEHQQAWKQFSLDELNKFFN